MKEPVFIVSFDSEGKWGLADCLSSDQVQLLTNRNLNEAFHKLLEILDKHDIKATFAFVGAFTMSFDEYNTNKEWFKKVLINGQNWLSSFERDIKEKYSDGWLNPESLEIVRKAGKHEIASHGFTHLPLGEDLIPENAFLDEMKAIVHWCQLKNLKAQTLVYPRNIVGYSDQLTAGNFIGYRDGIKGIKVSKFHALMDEINIFQPSQPHGISENGVVKIPFGHFLNWRVGFRKLIPMAVSIRRWRNMLENAVKKCKVIHLFAHPQDFLDGHNQYQMLDEILALISNRKKSGEILNLTMSEYSRGFINQSKGIEKSFI